MFGVDLSEKKTRDPERIDAVLYYVARVNLNSLCIIFANKYICLYSIGIPMQGSRQALALIYAFFNVN